jgi:hypothetical protein
MFRSLSHSEKNRLKANASDRGTRGAGIMGVEFELYASLDSVLEQASRKWV